MIPQSTVTIRTTSSIPTEDLVNAHIAALQARNAAAAHEAALYIFNRVIDAIIQGDHIATKDLINKVQKPVDEVLENYAISRVWSLSDHSGSLHYGQPPGTVVQESDARIWLTSKFQYPEGPGLDAAAKRVCQAIFDHGTSPTGYMTRDLLGAYQALRQSWYGQRGA